MFEDHFSFSQGGICDRCLEGISNYSNYPERGEILRKNWWIWACPRMKSTCGHANFHMGPSVLFFTLGWNQVIANHLDVPHHVVYFFEEVMPGVTPIFISLEDPVAHGSFDISSQIFAGSRWSQTVVILADLEVPPLKFEGMSAEK